MAEYIDKKTAIDSIASNYCMNCEHSNGILCRACEHQDDMDIIDDIPAADVHPVKHGRWIEKSEEYYRLWQDSGRSWDDMPYFVTGLKFACSNCFEQFDVNAEGVEKWNGCPLCLAKMEVD